MKNKLIISILFFILIFSFSATSQTMLYPEKYWIQFTDKNNSPYNIDYPQEFLSPEAIERRERYNIPITENDLPVNPAYVDSLKKLGIKIINVSKWLNGVCIQTTDTNLLDTIQTISFIKEYAPPKIEKIKTNQPEIKSPLQTLGYLPLKNKNVYDYGDARNQNEMLNIHYLHNQGFQGQGMVIAVIDAGFYKADELPAFDSMWVNNQVLGTRDFVRGGEVTFGTSTHGMQVLSTIVGNIPGKLVGTAPKANFWLLRSEDGATEYLIEEFNWLSAAEFSDSVGVDIITTSLGYSEFDDDIQNHKYNELNGDIAPVSIAADIAASKGILVVVSAGNEGNDNWKYITAPADADSVLTVGAVNGNGIYAYFSSLGPTADDRIKPDVVAKGIFSTVQASWGDVSGASGTSFSAPITAGAVTCLWQAHPNNSNIEIIEAIRKTASNTSVKEKNIDNKTGYGIPDFAKAHEYLSLSEEQKYFENNTFKIAPNPFYSYFNLEFSDEEIKQIKVEIYDVVGKLVFQKKINQENFHNKNIDITQLNYLFAGIYIVKISTNTTIFQQKMIKQ